MWHHILNIIYVYNEQATWPLVLHGMYTVKRTQYERGRSKSDRKLSGYCRAAAWCPGGLVRAGPRRAKAASHRSTVESAVASRMGGSRPQSSFVVVSLAAIRWLSSDALHAGCVRLRLGLRKVHQPGMRLLHIIDRLFIRLIVRRLEPVRGKHISCCWVQDLVITCGRTAPRSRPSRSAGTGCTWRRRGPRSCSS